MINSKNFDTKHLQWRAAIKQYDSTKKLTSNQVSLLVEASRMAPTSYGLQPIKLYVVSKKDIKEKLKAAGYNQPQFSDASHVFVFAARTNITKNDISDYIKRISDQRNVPLENLKDFEQMLLGSLKDKSKQSLSEWATRQAYLALGVTLDVAAQNKIDTTPMEGFNPEEVDKILELEKDGYHSVVILTAGFRSPEDKYSKMPKVRKTTKEFVKNMGLVKIRADFPLIF